MTSFNEMTVAELKAAAKSAGLKGYSKMLKADLVTLLTENGPSPEAVIVSGIDTNNIISSQVLEAANRDIAILTHNVNDIRQNNADKREKWNQILAERGKMIDVISVDNNENQVQIASPLSVDDADDEKVAIAKGTNNPPMRVLNRAQRRRLAARYRKGFIKKPEFMA